VRAGFRVAAEICVPGSGSPFCLSLFRIFYFPFLRVLLFVLLSLFSISILVRKERALQTPSAKKKVQKFHHKSAN
jgi:hypothetical protein